MGHPDIVVNLLPRNPRHSGDIWEHPKGGLAGINGLLGKCNKWGTKGETDDQSESKTDADQGKYLLKTEIHSFRLLRQPEKCSRRGSNGEGLGVFGDTGPPFEVKLRFQTASRAHLDHIRGWGVKGGEIGELGQKKRKIVLFLYNF
jgi:hypothetical protein